MKIILGSASPRRKDILSAAGIDFDIVVSDCEEIITKTLPAEVVTELSVQKSEDVRNKLLVRGEAANEDYLIIGADTIVAYGDEIYGKPRDKEDAVRMLSNLSGNIHQVYTGVNVIVTDSELNVKKNITFCSKTDVVMYEISDDEITRYVESGEPMDKAGAYAIQGGCAMYIKEIKGEYNNVVGFPIARLIYELKQEGIVLG